MKRKLTIVLLIFMSYFSYAQQLEVLEFHSDPTLIDAVRFPKNDLNGDRCGLVKIGMVMPDATFEGNVVHKEYKSGEWWVYLCKGSRWIYIKNKDYLPLRYEFLEPIQSNVTYVMTVKKETLSEFVKPPKASKAVDVSYYIKGGVYESRLYAKVEGIEYNVDVPNEGFDPAKDTYFKCLDVVEQEDFSGDGIKDALIKETPGCGNLGFYGYYIVSYSQEGFFSISNDVFGVSYTIEDWKGWKSIVIQEENVGYNHEKKYANKERFIFRNGELEKVETLKRQSVVTIKELIVSEFYENTEDKPLRLEYDLDENGVIDYIECLYWRRWDSMMVNSIVINGKKTKDPTDSAYRIGVLSSTTNGYHDLVVDDNRILKWDGEQYAFPDGN